MKVTCVILAMLLALKAQPVAGQGRTSGSPGTVEVVVAIVVEELQVRPVPLLTIEVWPQTDTIAKSELRTGLDGRVTHSAGAGAYRLRTATTAPVEGKTYAWSLDFELRSGKTTRLELTNANAIIDSSSWVSRALARDRAPEIVLYERVKSSVFQVRAGLSQGTGFLVDTLGGVVVTNAHVIEGADDVSIVLDSLTRVPAKVLASDGDADVALLRFHPSICSQCPRLRLAIADSAGTIAVPGERVVAIGFPLHQRSTVTSGIVSGVRGRAIISDVNINEGNSGGPLITMAGEVIGINTFGAVSQVGGPGLGGSISVERLGPLLRQVEESGLERGLPDSSLLPLLRGAVYPVSILRAVAETASYRAYRKFDELRYGDFVINTSTTLSKFVAFREYEDEVARDRRKREAKAGLSEEQRYGQLGEFRDWLEYVGDVLTPAVTIQVVPRAGETSGSAWGRALGALAGYYSQRAKYEFKGDVQAVRWYRNGTPVLPVVGGRTPQVVYENNQWIQMKDVAYRGVYVFPPTVFAPDDSGAPPSIVLQIDDLKHYDRFLLHELPAELVARIWNDFQPYYESLGVREPFVIADPDLFDSDFSERCARSPLCSGWESLDRSRPNPEP